jgi:hypothetical protein
MPLPSDFPALTTHLSAEERADIIKDIEAAVRGAGSVQGWDPGPRNLSPDGVDLSVNEPTRLNRILHNGGRNFEDEVRERWQRELDFISRSQTIPGNLPFNQDGLEAHRDDWIRLQVERLCRSLPDSERDRFWNAIIIVATRATWSVMNPILPTTRSPVLIGGLEVDLAVTLRIPRETIEAIKNLSFEAYERDGTMWQDLMVRYIEEGLSNDCRRLGKLNNVGLEPRKTVFDHLLGESE